MPRPAVVIWAYWREVLDIHEDDVLLAPIYLVTDDRRGA